MNCFEEKKERIVKGKSLFAQLMNQYPITERDGFIVILTQNAECIEYGIKYLKQYIQTYKLDNVYVFGEDKEKLARFGEEGAVSILCDSWEDTYNISLYMSIFENEEKIIFLTDRDILGAKIEQLLVEKKITLQEYVAIGVYRLSNI